MSQPSERPVVCPEGLDFLKLVSEQEDLCEATTRQRIPAMGEKAPVCLRNLGTVLSLLDRVASCFWGCRGGDHVIEYLAGRVCSSSRAALRLLLFGFYDESLLITRSIGEIVNLLWLFNQDAAALSQWQQLAERQRKEQFSPMKVRLRLETLKVPVPIDETRYRELCEVATHPTPHTKPQAYNPLEMPVIGATFQEGGVIIALNELAAATALALVPLPKLLRYDDQRRNEIKNAGVTLLRAVGALNIVNAKDKFAEMWRQTEEGERAS
jgi:hypothetical protein